LGDQPSQEYYGGCSASLSLQSLTSPTDLIIQLLPGFVAAVRLPIFFVFLASILAAQMFLAVPVEQSSSGNEPFSDLWKSFLGMYQIFTVATRKEGKWHQFIIAVFGLYLTLLCIGFYPGSNRRNVLRGKPATTF
jgi:hypothetical protein